MSRREYFAVRQSDPPPLTSIVYRRVRFEEADPLGIVWHGRYAGYFEEARESLGESYGFSYMAFRDSGVITPIKKMLVDFHRPLHYAQHFTVEARLHWTDAAKMNMDYIIRDEKQNVLTTGYTIQLFVDMDGMLQMAPPDFYETVRENWKSGRLKLT